MLTDLVKTKMANICENKENFTKKFSLKNLTGYQVNPVYLWIYMYGILMDVGCQGLCLLDCLGFQQSWTIFIVSSNLSDQEPVSQKSGVYQFESSIMNSKSLLCFFCLFH